MQLSKIIIKNYRLLIDAELDVDTKTTLIVGRNNTAKTSCIDCIDSVLNGSGFTYDDYPLCQRESLVTLMSKFVLKEITYVELCKELSFITIEFWVDYSTDAPEANLGALSPFIIDVDESITTAIIRVDNKLNLDELSLQRLLEPCLSNDEFHALDVDGIRDICRNSFSKLFDLIIYAINPCNPIPFANFLGIPCLILTDIDSMKDGRTKEVVSKGMTTSNSTIKWWMRQIKQLPENDTSLVKLSDIIALTVDQKTLCKCHIEFQTAENGLCGRSLEEAIINVNRSYYNLSDPITEDSLEFKEKSKTDFALDLICGDPNYVTPKYICDGLMWLNKQKVLE